MLTKAGSHLIRQRKETGSVEMLPTQVQKTNRNKFFLPPSIPEVSLWCPILAQPNREQLAKQNYNLQVPVPISQNRAEKVGLVKWHTELFVLPGHNIHQLSVNSKNDLESELVVSPLLPPLPITEHPGITVCANW
jgi:hypothetical protein